MKARLLISVLGLILVASTLARTAEFHVASTGNDMNSGRDLSSAWRSLARASASARAGDIVIVHDGQYSDAIAPVNNGTSGLPITFQGASGDHVVITASTGVQLTSGGQHDIIVDGFEIHSSSRVVDLRGASYVTIRNLTCYGGRATYQAFDLLDCSYCVIQNNYLDRQDPDGDSGGGDGLVVQGHSHHNLIEGNTVTRCMHMGIASPYSGQSFNIFRNNRAYNNHTNFGLYDGVERSIFEGNVGYYQGLVWTGGSGNCLQFTGRNCIIRYNTLYDDTATAYPYRQWWSVVGAGSGSANNLTPSVQYNKIYNNTIYGESDQKEWKKSGWRTDNYSADLVQNDNAFKNNIFAAAPDAQVEDIDDVRPASSANNRYEGNLLHGSGGVPATIVYYFSGGNDRLTLPAIKARRPVQWASTNIEGDPQFLNTDGQGHEKDFTLRSGSPAIDAGVHLTITTSGGSGMTVPVEDAGYFCDGWGVPQVEGDSIFIEGCKSVGIRLVEYSTNTLTLNGERAWMQGARVFYYRSDRFQGSAPDIGAHEFGSQGLPLGPVIGREVPLDLGNIGLYDNESLTFSISNSSRGLLAIDSITTGTGAFMVEPTQAFLRKGDVLTCTVRSYSTKIGPVRDSIVIWSNSQAPKLVLPVQANVLPLGAVHLVDGWNMISLPRIPLDPSSTALFPSIQNPFYGLDPVTGTYQKQLSLKEGTAYHIHALKDTVILLPGEPINSLQVSVPEAGWILLGALTRPVPADSLLFDPPDARESPVQTFDTKIGRYRVAPWLEPGKGYWVYVSKPCVIRW